MRRPGEITFYEELGVADDAPPEEIRDAFRALVRLLHPDQQTDEQLKNIAERQMRRVNRIYAVLSDPDSRRRYDIALNSLPAPAIAFSPSSREKIQRLTARFAWTGAALVTVAILVWLASDTPTAVPFPATYRTASQTPQPASHAAPPRAEARTDVAQLRADLYAAASERDAALREIMRLRGTAPKKFEAPAANLPQPPAPERLTAMPALAMTGPELPPAPRQVSMPLPALPTRAAPAKTFAGFWFYTRPGQGQRNRNTALYPPEFIEATLSEQGGLVHGTYRSRYQIVDRAISPDVNFEFNGVPNGATIVCPWSGPGGSRGELTLKITGENSMEIDWSATELGSLQGLGSGTARLTRRVE